MKTFQFFFLISLLVAYATARSVKFGLVAFGSTAKVKINDIDYPMTKPNNKDPYFTLIKDIDDKELIYKYSVDDKEEEFERILPVDETTTHNEFFGRKDTVKELPEFNHPEKGSWTRSIGKTPLFDDSYIPTVHLYGANANTTFTAATASIIKRVTFILKDDVVVVKNVALFTKNRNWDKFQFRLVMNYLNGDMSGVYGRYVLKFRDNNEDPTFFRQKLYSDIMNTIGAPTIQTIFARVYVNNIPVGLYVIQEEAASESFVRSAFHGDNNGHFLLNNYSELGHPLDCATGSDFEFVVGSVYSTFKPTNITRYDNSRIYNLNKAFYELDPNNDVELEKFNKEWFDIDTFLKAIAMQYLTGHWDSYWFYSTNFAVYDDPTESTDTTYKFYFICQDWDGTFGLNINPIYTRYADEEFTSISYKRYVNIEWGVDPSDAPHRYAIDKLLTNPNVQARFEDILTSIVKYIMNPKDFNKRLDAFVERFRDEVDFTFNVSPWRKGTEDIKWTMDDFERNINYRGRYGASYGLKEYIYKRASFINEEFQLGLDLGNNLYENIKECGPGYGKCSDGKCCSAYGYCGFTDEHCYVSSGCQVGFGICNDENDNVPITDPINENIEKVTNSVDENTDTIVNPINENTEKNTDPINEEYDNVNLAPVESPNNVVEPGSSETPVDGEVHEFTFPVLVADSTASIVPTSVISNKYIISDQITTTLPVVQTTKTIVPTVDQNTKTVSFEYTVSTDGYCGPNHGVCPNNKCCSKYGYCGISSEYCGEGCQVGYGKCGETTNQNSSILTLPVSSGACGAGVAVCSTGLCCSKYGYCGSTESYCGVGCQKEFGYCFDSQTTQNASNVDKSNDSDVKGRCGPQYGICEKSGYCCSKYGYCGKSSSHCGVGCQPEYGFCY